MSAFELELLRDLDLNEPAGGGGGDGGGRQR